MSGKDTKPLLIDSSTKPTTKTFPIIRCKILVFTLLCLLCGVIIYFIISYTLNIWPFKQDSAITNKRQYPNIIFILMDDFAFIDNPYYSSLSNNDFRNNNQISFQMNNLEHLFSNSIRLNYHYTETACSPTRSALLSGVYSWRTGVIRPILLQTATHCDKNLTLLSEYLTNSKANYNTIIAGKWHIGASSITELPFNRGFNDENNLFISGSHIDYFMKNNCITFNRYDESAISNDVELDTNIIDERNDLFNNQWCDYDFYNNDGQFYDENNSYIEELFADKILQFLKEKGNDENPYFIYYPMHTPHFPLTEPPIYDVYNNIIDYSNCDNITSVADNYRILFCKMLIYIDIIIGHIFDNINLNDTIIIFTGDNGGQPAGGPRSVGGNVSAGQNLPFRGVKSTVFEGGIRTGAAIYGGYDYLLNIEHSNCDYNELFHVTDWVPTILNMIDIELDDDNLDGINLWNHIKNYCQTSNNFIEDDDDDDDDGDDITKRNEIISIRLCDDGSFGSTYIRKRINNTNWKLIINGTRIDCTSSTHSGNNSYYFLFDASFTMIPNEIWYSNFNDNSNNNTLFQSKCYDNMNNTERNNITNFLYDEYMLFNMDNDNIEACNVANKYPEIMNELLSYLNEQLAFNKYNGPNRPLPKASALLSQLINQTFICENDFSFSTQWKDSNQYNNISWNDWNFVWSKAIQLKKNCDN